MKNEVNLSHKRYFLYRHIIKSEEISIMYRTSTGDWSRDVAKAMMWPTVADATKKAKAVIKSQKRYRDADPHTYCVGEMIVATNGFFANIVVK